MRKLLAAAALLLAACAPPKKDTPDAAGDGAAPAGVSYARDIRPMFVAVCNDCHHPTSAIGYDFTNPFDPQKGIIGRANSWASQGSMYPKIVDPGNAAASSIVAKVSRTDLDAHVDGSPMPFEVPRLTPAEVDSVRQWIASGANNDALFTENVAPILGTQITLGRASGKCTWCHYPGSPNGLNVLAPFDERQGLVNRNSIYGGKVVAPGDPDASSLMKKLTGTSAGPQMPLHHPRLSAGQVQRLRDWIDAGAQNN